MHTILYHNYIFFLFIMLISFRTYTYNALVLYKLLFKNLKSYVHEMFYIDTHDLF